MIKKLDGMLETVDYETNSPFMIRHNYENENYPMHWHSAVEIIMPIQNSYKVIINDRSFQLDENDIIIIPSGDIHEIHSPTTSGQRIFLQFDLSLLKTVSNFATSAFVFVKPYHITPTKYPKLHRKLQAFINEMLSECLIKSDYYEAVIVAKIIELVTVLARNHHDEDYIYAENIVKRKDHITKFNACIEYINKHYRDNLTLDMVSHVIGFSKYHFARWFKQFASISFYDYITQVRIRTAETILLSSNASITEIALESGFQSITTFNRIFKESKKCTPTEYRNFVSIMAQKKLNATTLLNDEDLNNMNNSTFITSSPPPTICVSNGTKKTIMNQPKTSMKCEDGKLINPFIYADVPDLDAIRVGDAYYMTSTTMHFSPGCPVMKSYDLVNWEIVNYVYDILDDSDTMTMRNDKHAYGKGSWASSIRYHNGTFYVALAAYNTGKTYIFQTEDIENGPWRRATLTGIYHDMSLLFDDGRVFMVYGGGAIKLIELTSDATAILQGGLNKIIIEKANVGGEGGLNAEGAHIYKLNGKYYIFLISWPRSGTARRLELCYRADSIDGQYEGIVVLDDPLDFRNAGVAQGGIVDTPNGDWYTLLFQDHGSVGRIPVLVPFVWENDWPVFGIDGKVPVKMDIPIKGFDEKNIVVSDEFYQSDIRKNYSSINDLSYRYTYREKNKEVKSDTDEMKIEVVENGDFKNGIEAWNNTNGANISTQNEESTDDTPTLLVSDRTTAAAGAMQVVTGKVAPGGVYKITAKIKYTSGADMKLFNICIRNGSASATQIMCVGMAKKGEWSNIEGIYTLPKDADLSETIVFIETRKSDNPNKGTDLMDFYVRDVSIVQFAMTKDIINIDGESEPNDSNLALPWQWNHNPDNNHWSLTKRRGYLRLTTGGIYNGLTDARNTLTQRTYGPTCSGSISIDVSNMKDGDVAGLAALQEHYGYVGVKMTSDTKSIVMVNADSGQVLEIQSIPLLQDTVYLKIDFDFRDAVDTAMFFYSLNGIQWTSIGNTLKMRYTLAHFVGYRFALFNYATENIGGYVDFDYFRAEDNLTVHNDKAVLLNAVMSEEQEVIGVVNTPLEISLSLDALPKLSTGNYNGIFVSVNIPEYLDITEVVFCNDNIIGNTSYTYSNKRLQLSVSGDNVSFLNNASKLFSIIKLKVIDFVPDDITVTIKPDYIYVDGGNAIYNVHDTYSKITLKHLETKAAAKIPGFSNPLVSHKYGADPYALIYDDRLYIYVTSDAYEYDDHGKLINNTYGKINTITVISSADMINWTDHGEIPVAGPNGAAKWAVHSWAPAIAHKVIEGKDKFFLYFANDASNIGVLISDSPIGPWSDPLGQSIINRRVPGVEDVTWCFDPAVLVDDDGAAYLYFGGGIPGRSQEAALHPKTARVIKLGDDMISTVGTAELIDGPALFEDSGIHKYNGKYYYTYCSNFAGYHPEGYPPYGEIACMVSDNPMGPFEYRGSILQNPTKFFGVGGNNHHCVFNFKDQWYITYHAQTLGKALGKVMGYRSPHINKLEFYEDGNIKLVEADMKGVSLPISINPYTRVEAETIAWSAGIDTAVCDAPGYPIECINLHVTDIHNGDWVAVANVDFGDKGAKEFIANVASSTGGEIEIRIDSLLGEVIGILGIGSTGGETKWELKTCEITKATGIHNVFFKFNGDSEKNLFNFDYWKFIEM